MSQKSIKKNYIYNLFYQILTLITPLITTPYISRILGADNIGMVSYAESIVSYFTLFATMGIPTYGQREVSYTQDSIEKRSLVFWNTKILGLFTSGISLILYLVFVFCQPDPRIYLILIMNILIVSLDITWFFQGMEEFGKIVLRNIIVRVVNVAYIFFVIRSADDVYLYVFGYSFFILLSYASLWGLLPKYIKKVNIQDLHPFRDIKIILSLFVPTIAIQVYTVLDKTMIGFITQNTFENGYYEQAIKISKMVLAVITALGTVMVPRIGHFFKKQNTKEVQRLIYRSYRFVWFLGVPLCFGLIMVSENFVPWFFGTGYEKVTSLLHILAFLILAIGISNVTGAQYLVPTKRQNALSVSVILGACTNFMMNLFLIPRYGSTGAAVASVVAEVVVTASQLYFVRKELSLFQIFREGIPYYIAGVLMSVVLHFVSLQLLPSILNTAILVVSGALVYFCVLLVLRDEFFISNIKSVLAKIRKKIESN